MEIDIRDSEIDKIDRIRFSDLDSDVVVYIGNEGCDDKETIQICPEDSGTFYLKDIDNLIKALQKAKEIWS